MTLAGQKRPPATLAMQCAICHGPLAAAVYKQLRDFKTGARTTAVMGPFAVKLSEQDMLDLAAYYSYLPRQPGSHPDPAAAVPQIVARGAPMRNVPACSSCHGTTDANLGTPWLDGQSDVYIKAQLQAFTTGCPAKRHQRADEKHRAADDARRDR
jgi:cytochrome c553